MWCWKNCYLHSIQRYCALFMQEKKYQCDDDNDKDFTTNFNISLFSIHLYTEQFLPNPTAGSPHLQVFRLLYY